MPPEVVRRVFARIRSEAKVEAAADRDELTQREKEILVSFCRGMSYVAIAAAREVKVVTVRNAIYTIQSEAWAFPRSRRSWCGPHRTGCWMTDGMGGFRGNAAAHAALVMIVQ